MGSLLHGQARVSGQKVKATLGPHFLRGHSPTMPLVQSLKAVVSYFFSIFQLFKINSSFNDFIWSEVEVSEIALLKNTSDCF